MKTRNFLLYFLYALLLAAFPGCGNNAVNNNSVSALAASKACIDCHVGNSKSISTITGERITDTWKLSAHNTANGAGCLDCHSSAHYYSYTMFSDCRGCHAKAHSNNDISCGQCHGATSIYLADCRSCHATPHNNSIPVDVAVKNPDAAGKCFSCHKSKLNSAHFRNMTAGVNAVSSAMYVTRNFEKGCTACHEPHNPLKGIGAAERKAWAKSGHGKVYSPAFEDEDFKTNKSCIRCHTSTGYSNFLANNWTTPFPATTWGVAGDKGREVLTCRTCHIDYSFKVKPAPAFVAPYNSSKSPQVFPDVGESNLCLACHSGRESGDTINAITDFTNVSFKNSHYMAAAGLMYMKTGFINFTSLDAALPGTDSSRAKGPMTYGKSLQPNSTGSPIKTGSLVDITPVPGGVVGGVTSAHRRLGTPDIYGRETWTPLNGVFDTGGPCVTCHINANVLNMPAPDLGVNVGGTYNGKGPYFNAAYGMPTKRSDGGHSFSATSTDAAQQVCIPCHADEVILINPATSAELKLEEARPYFKAALAVITVLLKNKYNIEYDPAAHPYFYKGGMTHVSANAVKDWTLGKGNNPDGNKFGRKLMGACYNLNLMSKDPGAYVHARNFVQRLLFDTIDFLDNGVINKSSAATLIAIDPTTFPDNNDHWVYKAGGLRK